ncbi:hypothetical protein E4U38_003213 [Claviceps purpurea]|nr:hypothetical protein E4U38_003213 [Claviceps purpurea]KAG6162629.1 hypothetical protein E4U51_006252 [Claviceps purpurea]KAG6170256.1 hypothetical protein E4U11_002842 [Claviceps purpurea]KAG6263075.1 hypothetical protein E4U49_002586 [Claviceps purpurea]
MTTANLRRASDDAAIVGSAIPNEPSSHRRLSVVGNEAVEMTESTAPIHAQAPLPAKRTGLLASLGLGGVARRTLGICLLLVTVFLWTLSNFLASSIFSDHTYDKPFFLVYANSSVFAISLLPRFYRYCSKTGARGIRNDLIQLWTESKHQGGSYAKASTEDDALDGEQLMTGHENGTVAGVANPDDERLSFRETGVLSLEFSMLWFLANYFASACLEYTSVASVTILTSTSSAWTLVFGALFRVETFSVRKLIGVMASLVGIVLISTVDLSGESDENRGSFPHKTPSQIAIGDAMAFFSAIMYGLYVTVMKRRVGNEDKVDMRLFFGLVGTFNLLLLWPLFFILDWTSIEPFEMPPTAAVVTVIVVNSVASFVSDICWAFAMLLTTPLVVTVGLSLTIPLSLIGEMVQYGQYSSFVYWIGAAVVFVSFVFINNESREDEDKLEVVRADRAERDSV